MSTDSQLSVSEQDRHARRKRRAVLILRAAFVFAGACVATAIAGLLAKTYPAAYYLTLFVCGVSMVFAAQMYLDAVHEDEPADDTLIVSAQPTASE